MPVSFGSIGLAEPSTITKSVGATIIARGSTNEYQEILVLGDPQSSLGLARVIATAPTSTEMGLIVRIASGPSSAADLPVAISGNSTVVQGTSPWIIGGNSTVVISAGNSSVTIAAVAVGVRMNIGSTAADNAVVVSGNSTVAPLAGSTWATRPIQSSAADLQMTATPAAGSTWRTQPGSTAWASSAGFHFDSSGALQVNSGAAGASSTQVTVSQLLDSSGGSVTAADSANNAIRVNVVAGAAGGSTIVTVSTGSVTVWPGSSAWQVQVSNGNSSVTIAAVAAGVRMNIGSTAADNAVVISGVSTVAPQAGSTWATRPIQSSAADLQMTATPAAGSTWSVRPIQSSQADLRVTAYQSSAVEFKTQAWQFDGIGNAIESSTDAVPHSTMRGLAVRSILPDLLSVASSNLFASTTFTVVTSNATMKPYVYAYSITTTNQTPTKIGFYAGSTLVWPIVLAAISSAVSGVNLAVSPPAYLFAGTTGGILALKTAGSTGLGYKAGVSYWID